MEIIHTFGLNPLKLNNKPYRKGRGAQKKVHNRFLQDVHETRDDFLEYCRQQGESAEDNKTRYLQIHPKTVVNKVTSPDVGMSYSMNPYQGCEHGCIYCYARNSHEYWGYGPGLDFEQVILVKKNAAVLLESKIKRNNWKAETIVLSGNTDCYQPAERKYKITRACLEVFLKYRHPVGIITKNALVLRDLDILRQLAKDRLVGVNVSVTSLSEDTRRILEPRTASLTKRLETIRLLTENNIPVNAMLAPIIPGINSHEVLGMAKAVADAGASSFAYTVVRLNGAIGQIFTDWIQKALPNKAEKVLHLIEACHQGNLNDSRFGTRGRGDGKVAEHIRDLVELARRIYFKDRTFPKLNTELHDPFKNGQWRLF